MLRYAILFFIVTIASAVLGFGVIEGPAAWIARVLFLIFLMLFVISLFGSPRNSAHPDHSESSQV